MNVYKIAAEAEADPKTVRKWLDPAQRGRMKPATVRRIDKAVAEIERRRRSSKAATP